MDLSHRLTQPLTIGGRPVQSRLFMAPMSKLGNVAFRTLVAHYGGAGLIFSEMCSARTVRQGGWNPKSGFVWDPAELPRLVCQLFGDDPDTMADAAQRVASEGFFGVDINLGCSVARVCRHGCGAALLKTPDKAVAIVAAIRRAVSIPVFVKYRTGWSDDISSAVALARRFEEVGADALTFHPRVAPDRRTRPPKWHYIGLVQDAVAIPVFGNGNVFHADDCLRMMTETGCAGVSLGRLAVTRPWIFAQWILGLDPDPSLVDACVVDYARRLLNHFDPSFSYRRFHRFIFYFSSNFTFGHSLRRRINRTRTLDAALSEVRSFLLDEPELLPRPKISLLH